MNEEEEGTAQGQPMPGQDAVRRSARLAKKARLTYSVNAVRPRHERRGNNSPIEYFRVYKRYRLPYVLLPGARCRSPPTYPGRAPPPGFSTAQLRKY
jgi:hypothetical protein